MSSPDNAISVSSLSHSYNGRDFVVDDVSFNVRKGEIFGLLGKNGAAAIPILRIRIIIVVNVSR